MTKLTVGLIGAGRLGRVYARDLSTRISSTRPAQLENFARNVLEGRTPPIRIDDGIEALKIALAATRARETGQCASLSSPEYTMNR